MREYLFRGKRLDNGEWVEGGYCQHDKVKVCFTTDDPQTTHLIIKDGFCDWGLEPPLQGYEVDPETVGQFTGLRDCKRTAEYPEGQMIFEGDIVRTQPFFDKPYSKKAKSTQHIGVVEYIAGDTGAEWRVRIEDYIGYGHCAFSAFHNCEVIGNIHDNPELLEEGGKE